MSSPGMKELMRQRWADPVWAARQRAAIAEGHARRWQAPVTRPIANGRRRGTQKSISIYLDDETFQAVRSVAQAQNKTLTEILRTYVEWGLDVEGA